MGRAVAALESLLAPAVTALGYELWGVEYLPQGRHSLLRVYIDSPAGITVDDCERVSRQVSGVLDVEDPIKEHYTLEVSSPGLDRPLFTPEQFARYRESEIQIRLTHAQEGRRKFKGKLLAVEGNTLVISVDGQEMTLDLADVEKASVVPHW